MRGLMEMNLNKDYKGGDGFIDRSKVRILLCDNDTKSLGEVLKLLLNCSYHVTAVKSARQVINTLNAEGADIDIILTEVDLPMTKGMKMLKYIMRDTELRRIPVIMISSQDEVSIVVKCLKLGAADYLVKPLRRNELLNLWIHVWRRRRMLGLAEKNMLNYDFDLVASEPSDANTNSATLFSDDTDDKSRRCTNTEVGVSAHQDDEPGAAAVTSFTSTVDASATSAPINIELAEPSSNDLVAYRPDEPGISHRRTGRLSYVPKKSQLRIGESSAFFTYVKSNVLKEAIIVDENVAHRSIVDEKVEASGQLEANNAQICENKEARENYSKADEFHSGTSIPDPLERSCTPPMSTEFPQRNYSEENYSQGMVNSRNEPQASAAGLSAQTAYPYYIPGVMNQYMMQPPAQLYTNNFHDLQAHASSAVMSQYSHLPAHVNGMSPYQYYPLNMCMQPGQLPTPHTWPQSCETSTSTDVNVNRIDRREAALVKFRQKRKERCFDKKIRYANRKRLAERRPRVKGQFVRKVNGVDVDLNGQPASNDDDEEEEEEEEYL